MAKNYKKKYLSKTKAKKKDYYKDLAKKKKSLEPKWKWGDLAK